MDKTDRYLLRSIQNSENDDNNNDNDDDDDVFNNNLLKLHSNYLQD